MPLDAVVYVGRILGFWGLTHSDPGGWDLSGSAETAHCGWALRDRLLKSNFINSTLI